MKLRELCATAIFAMLAGWPLAARATTSVCTNAANGTPCIDSCIAQGTCMNAVCKPITLRPDGTPCSSENLCTEGDNCQAGTCIEGTPRACPDFDSCLVGVCRANVGCSLKNICPPDLAGADLSDVPDLLGVDLNGVDMCTVPPGSEFYSCDDPDAQFFHPQDLGTDASANEPFHVRGSRVGDCDFGAGSARDSIGIAFLLAALLALSWRVRRTL